MRRNTIFYISIIEYLNAVPLNYVFQHGVGWEHFHLKFHVLYMRTNESLFVLEIP